MNIDEIPKYLRLAWVAHNEHARDSEDRFRRHDGITPYFVHPAWAAMTIMQEPLLSVSLRWNGFRVLCLHDVEEDTTFQLPGWVPPVVRSLVCLMSFESSDDEMKKIWSRAPFVRLLKLYDKVSNLLDGSWMDSREIGYRERYEQYALSLADDVESRYGVLNICQITRAICKG